MLRRRMQVLSRRLESAAVFGRESPQRLHFVWRDCAAPQTVRVVQPGIAQRAGAGRLRRESHADSLGIERTRARCRSARVRLPGCVLPRALASCPLRRSRGTGIAHGLEGASEVDGGDGDVRPGESGGDFLVSVSIRDELADRIQHARRGQIAGRFRAHRCEECGIQRIDFTRGIGFPGPGDSLSRSARCGPFSLIPPRGPLSRTPCRSVPMGPRLVSGPRPRLVAHPASTACRDGHPEGPGRRRSTEDMRRMSLVRIKDMAAPCPLAVLADVSCGRVLRIARAARGKSAADESGAAPCVVRSAVRAPRSGCSTHWVCSPQGGMG